MIHQLNCLVYQHNRGGWSRQLSVSELGGKIIRLLGGKFFGAVVKFSVRAAAAPRPGLLPFASPIHCSALRHLVFYGRAVTWLCISMGAET